MGIAVAATLTLVTAPQAHAAACTTSWTGTSGPWNDANNWSAGVPDANDVACIQQPGDYQVDIQAQDGNTGNATATAKELHLGGSSGTQAILISGETVSNVDYDATLTLAGGTGSASDVNSHGVIQIQRGTGANAGICAGSPLTNDGTIHTLGGFGPARILGGNIKNQGTLTLSIDTQVPSGSPCSTPGVLENNGGTVTLGGSRTLTVNGTYAQTSGTTSTTNANVLIDNGTLSASGGTGTFRIRGSSGSLGSDVGAGIALNVEGTASADANLNASSPVTNAGTINLTSSDASHGALLTADGTLTNTGTIATLLDFGGSRALGGTIDNQGTLSIGANTGSQVVKTLHLTNSGALTVAPAMAFTLSDLTQSGGTLTVDGTLEYGTGTLTVGGGTLEGTGTVHAATLANNGGTVHPGDSPGQLVVDGSYSQGAGGTLALEIQGETATDISQLYVTGGATLGGTIAVTTTGTQQGTFRVLQASSVAGSFASTSFVGQHYAVSTDSTGVTLTAPPGNAAKPSIGGVPRVGNTLTCNKGIWVPQGSPFTYQYRWLRDGVAIAGASAAKRKVAAVDQGHKLSCRVTATNGAGSTPATSNPRAVPREPVDRGVFVKKTVRATKAGDVNVLIRNPNPLAVGGKLTVRNKTGKAVGSSNFTIAARSTKPVKVHLSKGTFAKLKRKGQLKLGATLVLSKGKVKRTANATLTVTKPKP